MREWDLNNPKHVEEALNYFYSLPDSDDDSDAEADFIGRQEVNDLDLDDITLNQIEFLNPACEDVLDNIEASSLDETIEKELVQPKLIFAQEIETEIVTEETITIDSEYLSLECQQNREVPEEDFCDSDMIQLNVDRFFQNDGRNENNFVELDVPEPVVEDCEELNSDWDDDSEWGNNTEYFDNIDERFNENPEIVFEKSDTELNFFEKIFDSNIISSIVTQTNLYASQKQAKNWADTNETEIKAFIGCLILMAIHELPHLENYWSSDPVLRFESISKVMTAKRFKKLIENIHCNNNETNSPRSAPNHDKLHKVRPLIDSLNTNIRIFYKPTSFLSIDESMIPFKGRSSLKQYMPMKPVKRGYKVWCLADAKTGYILNFSVYTGRSEVPSKIPLGERVVLELSKYVTPKSVIGFDNFFTNPTLMRKLRRKKIYSLGTVRSNVRGLDKFIQKDKKIEKLMKRGEFQFKTKGCIAATKWMDNKPVCMLSTLHSPRKTAIVKRRNKDGSRVPIPCPHVVAAYNEIMGGVDRFDQLRERYAIGRRSIKWWHRILYYLVDLAIVNSFIMWKCVKNKKEKEECNQLSFRIRLAKQLISGYSSRKRRGRPINYLSNKSKVPDDVKLANVGSHMPLVNENYRRCKHCSTKSCEKRTRYTCSACEVPLCINNCFAKFHNK